MFDNINMLLMKFKGREMTIKSLSAALNKLSADSYLQYNGRVFKWEKYFMKISYINTSDNFEDSTIKIIDIIET